MRLLYIVLLLMLVSVSYVGAAFSPAGPAYDKALTDSSGIVADTNYVLNLSTGGDWFYNAGKAIDYFSCQAVVSSETHTAIAFTDGVRGSGKIQIFTGNGIAGSTVTINGVGFIEGRDWTAVSYSSTTATSLYTVLQSSISYILFSKGATDSVIYATSTVVDTVGNYVFTSSVSSITVTSMTGGSSTYFDYLSDTIMQTNDYVPGLGLLFNVVAGTSPAGLISQTTYYAIPSSTLATLKLATTKLAAISGTAIDIVSQTYPGGSSYTLTPLNTLASSPFILKWQVSNDNKYWCDLVVTSVTVTSATAPTSLLWDFGFTSYKYIQCALQSGSFGSLKLKLQGYGKRLIP